MNPISETDAIQDKIAKTWLDSGRELSCISEVYFIIREKWALPRIVDGNFSFWDPFCTIDSSQKTESLWNADSIS